MAVHIKYPRTFHLPWSEGITDDDKVMKTTSFFHGKEVVVTEKMDGECTTIYRDHIHARSIDSKYHWSRTWVKKLWSDIRHTIPENERICGENMYAVHSIVYTSLPSYFLAFSVWEDDVCFSWDKTIEECERLNLFTVPVLYRGVYDEKIIKSLFDSEKAQTMEGYVVRLASEFKVGDFNNSVAKYVRENHISTDEHWMRTGNEINMVKRVK